MPDLVTVATDVVVSWPFPFRTFSQKEHESYAIEQGSGNEEVEHRFHCVRISKVVEDELIDEDMDEANTAYGCRNPDHQDAKATIFMLLCPREQI